MPNRVVFRDKGVVDFEVFESLPMVEGCVRVESTVSLISTGTEGICLHRLFEPGSHWDGWVKYPFYPGYSIVGQVTEVGPGAEKFSVGQRVVAKVPHASEVVAPTKWVVGIPDDVSDIDASWFALAKIGFQGWKASEQMLGDDVLIVGAGPIGQMAVRWAVAAGARRAVVMDTVPFRLDLAEAGGATATLCVSVFEAREAVLDAFGGRLPKIVVDTTGFAAVFAACLPLVQDFGRLVILGDTGKPTEQHLTLDVIRRGLRIVGAHDMHDTDRWHLETIDELFFDLLRRKRFNVEGLSTHAFAAADAARAYELLTTHRNETMGVRFEWK